MRAAFMPAALALASVVLSISAVARADGGPPLEPAPAMTPASEVAPAMTPAPAPAPAPASASEVAEARREIASTMAQMRAGALLVRDALRATRKRGTKRQIRCVDEALSRSDVAVRHGRELGDEILAAYARDDLDAARGARGLLAELHRAQRQAATAASGCAARRTAQPVVLVTTVTLRIDPAIAPAL